MELELGEVTNPQRAHVSRVTREPESFHNLDSIPRTSAMPSQGLLRFSVQVCVSEYRIFANGARFKNNSRKSNSVRCIWF